MVDSLRAKDRRFEAFLTNVTSATHSGLTSDKRDERRDRADADDLEFCRIYFPHIFFRPWNAAHRHIAGLRRGNYTVSGFRYSGKTAFAFISKIIKPLAQGVGGILNVSTRKQELSDERTAGLIRIMERNRTLMYDYDITIHQDLKGYYIVNNTVLLGTSVQVGLRGYISDEFKRFYVSINDDLYDRMSVDSERDNEKVYNFITSEVYGMMEDNGLSITLGNSITEDCPIVRLKSEHPDHHFSLPALIDDEGNADENGVSSWPEYRSTEEWHQHRADTPVDIWNGDYMDRPFERGGELKREWLRSINVNTTQILVSISAADPAHGTSPEACYKSIATVSATNKQEVILRDMYLRQEGYFDFFNYVDYLRSRIEAWRVLLFENDFGQWGFAHPYYLQWMQKTRKTLTIVTHFSKDLKTEYRGSDKDSRILNLVHPHQTGMLLYDEVLGDLVKGSPANRDMALYISQYLAYGKSKKKLDGLDALATAYIMVFRYIETGSFKPLKKRRFVRPRLFGGRQYG